MVVGVLQNLGLEARQVGQIVGFALPFCVRPARQDSQSGAGKIEQDGTGLFRRRIRGRIGHKSFYVRQLSLERGQTTSVWVRGED